MSAAGRRESLGASQRRARAPQTRSTSEPKCRAPAQASASAPARAPAQAPAPAPAAAARAKVLWEDPDAKAPRWGRKPRQGAPQRPQRPRGLSQAARQRVQRVVELEARLKGLQDECVAPILLG